MKKTLYYIIVLLSLNLSLNGQNACLGPLNLNIVGSATGTPLEIQYITSDIYCVGSAEGSIELIVEGGTPTYTCIWSTGEESEGLNNLMPGMYSVTVTDGTGCQARLDIPVTEMTPLADQLTMAEYTGCGNCYLQDGQSSYIYQDDDYMVHIRDVNDGISIEDIEVCINVRDESYILPEDTYYLKRSFAFNAATTVEGRSRIRLFFNEDELQELAVEAGVTIIDTNTLSVKKYTHDFIDQDEFIDEPEHVEDITFNLFDSDNFIWEISFLETRFTPTQYNQYFIQLQNEEIISSTIDEEELADASFYLIENPVMDWVQLESENFYHVGDGQISIVNASGQSMYTSTFENRLMDYEKINVSNFPSGVYFFVLEYSDIEFSKTFKFIKI